MKKRIIAALIVLEALAGVWYYFHVRTIDVWLYTDSAFRLHHESWPALVDARFKEVNRIFGRNGTGVLFRLVDTSKTDPTSNLPGIDSRRANMIFHEDRQTDIYVILTGVREGERTGSVSPFTNIAVVVDYADKSEEINARLMANELAHLFGAPHDPARLETLMSEKPESDQLSPRTAVLIRKMRDYPFAMGIDGLSHGAWGKTALAALADNDPGPHASAAAHAHAVLGTALLNERKQETALVHFKAAVQVDPKDVTSRLNLAEAYTRDGQDNLALEQGRAVAKLAPDSALAHRALGALLGRNHQPDQAVQELRIAARLEPNNADTQLLLGVQLAGMFGHIDEAIATMREAVRLSPDSAKAQAGLQKALTLKQDVTAALAKQREAVQRNPNDADAHYSLAKAEARMGDLTNAIQDFQKSAELRPTNGTPHVELAELLLVKGDVGGAWQEVKKARSLGTEPPPAFLSRLPPQK